jgi:propionyl-CoA carboxylase alpha chain
LSTDFIPLEFPDGFHGADLPAETQDLLVSIVAVAQHLAASRDAAGASTLQAVAVPQDWTALIGPPPRQARDLRVAAVAAPEEGFAVTLDGRTRLVLTRWRPGDFLFEGKIDGHAVTAQLDRKGIVWWVVQQGAAVEIRVVPRHTGRLAALMPVKMPADLSKYLLSPMPGLLVSIAVAEGQTVKAGEELAVVEAMKMENVLRAERDGKVLKIHATARDSLAVDQIILEFDVA